MSSAAPRFCDQCGFQFASESRFCGGCGKPRGDNQSSRSSATQETAKAPRARPVKWRSTADDADLDEFPYAQAGSDSFLTGALMLGAATSVSGGPQVENPPVGTTWFSGRDDGVTGRCGQGRLGELSQVFGGFVKSLGLLDGPWDALEVVTPLGNPGLIMMASASGAGQADLRLMVPLAYAIEPGKRNRAQVRLTIEWLLRKMESPYISYVPPVESASQREGLLDMIIARSGRPYPGPLSDTAWLSDPFVSAVGANFYAFPGAGSLRVGVLDEQRSARQRAMFRGGKLDIVDLKPGTVDLYAGWQIEPSGMGAVGLMALGHRSLLGAIDAIAEVPALARELGGLAPSA